MDLGPDVGDERRERKSNSEKSIHQVNLPRELSLGDADIAWRKSVSVRPINARICLIQFINLIAQSLKQKKSSFESSSCKKCETGVIFGNMLELQRELLNVC